MAKKASRTVVFQTTGDPAKKSGKPPEVDTTDPNKYWAYFENEQHEQFIFTYNYEMCIGNLWLSKDGWEQPVPVYKSSAHKAAFGPSEKAWLKACWTVIAAEELRRERSKRMREPNAFQEQPVVRTLPPHEELVAHMEHLYDALIQKDVAPNCSRTDFAYGWTSFIELMSQLEAKYKNPLTTDSDNSDPKS